MTLALLDRERMELEDLSFGPSSMTLRWKLRYFLSANSDRTRFFESPRFQFLDAQWRLQATTMDGVHASDWMKLWVCRVDTPMVRTHRLRCTMWIRKKDGTEFGGWTGEWEFGVQSPYWTTLPIVGRSEILREEDRLTVLCFIRNCEDSAVSATGTQTRDKEFIGDLKKQTTSVGTLEKKEPEREATADLGVDKLVQNFKDLLSTGQKSDLTLRVRDQEFKCHEAVLSARAPVFAAWLQHDRQDGAKTVQVEDCDPEAFALFLKHLYTGGVEILSTNTVFSLYRIADKYDANDLKSTCVRFISGNMSVQTFCDALSLLLQYDDSHLFEATIAFFSKNMREIMATAGWQDFLKDNTAEGNLLLMKALDLKAGTLNLYD